MRKDKGKAYKLRKLGHSYKEIREALAIPLSTLSDWFIAEKWSNEIAIANTKRQLEIATTNLRRLNKIRGEHLSRVYDEALQEAVKDYELLKYHPLFIAGLMIYWGEGNKASKNRVSIANTEAKMIKIFRIFLKNICGVQNPKCWLLLYPDLDENECKNYWMINCGLQPYNFTKSIVIKGKSPVKRLSHGVCNLGISSTYLKRKILKWIELLSEDIGQEKYLRV